MHKQSGFGMIIDRDYNLTVENPKNGGGFLANLGSNVSKEKWIQRS